MGEGLSGEWGGRADSLDLQFVFTKETALRLF